MAVARGRRFQGCGVVAITLGHVAYRSRQWRIDEAIELTQASILEYRDIDTRGHRCGRAGRPQAPAEERLIVVDIGWAGQRKDETVKSLACRHHVVIERVAAGERDVGVDVDAVFRAQRVDDRPPPPHTPNLVMDLRLTNATPDLVEEGIDVAFQLGPLRDGRYVARRLWPVPYVLCASRDLVARRPALLQMTHPRQLTAQPCVFTPPIQVWRFEQPDGSEFTFTPKMLGATVDDLALGATAVRRSLGVGYLPYGLVSGAVGQALIQLDIADWRPQARELFAVYPASHQLSPKGTGCHRLRFGRTRRPSLAVYSALRSVRLNRRRPVIGCSPSASGATP